MRDACIRAMAQALGRPPSDVEVRNIESRIHEAMVREARRNPDAWRQLPPDQRMLTAAKSVVQQMAHEAAKKTERIDLQAAVHARLTRWRNEQVAAGRDASGVDALQRALTLKYDMQEGGMVSVESRANAIFDDAMRQMQDVFEAVQPGLWQRMQEGTLNSEPLRRAFVDALHNRTTGVPPEIVQAAKLYHQISEAMRVQFNAAGGVVGRLESWGAPHTWSARLINKAGERQFVRDMMDWIDPKAYVHADGTRFSDTEIWDMLRAAWRTLASEGVIDMGDVPGFPGGAMKANRHRHHRILHLRPEAAYDALKAYSELNILEAMQGRLKAMSRDLALIETFGPNADHEFASQLRTALAEDAMMRPASTHELSGKADYLQNLYDYIAGNAKPPRNRSVAEAFDTLAALQVSAKLGGATITSLTDFAPLYQTALLNRLNPFKVWLNSSLIWAPRSRRYARRMGLMLETLKGDAERYSMEHLTGSRISRQVASAVVRASFLTHVTEARRLGFSMTMMDAIGHLTRQSKYRDVSALQEGDHRILASKGITQEIWNVWRAAELDRWGGNHTLLTPDRIMAIESVPFELRREAVLRLLSIVREEQDLAVITPGARERVQMSLGTRRGTVGGELVRSAMLFKSFPWTVLQRHGERAKAYRGEGPMGLGRFGYAGALFVNMTLLGVATLWAKDMLAGKDPRSFDVLDGDEDQRSFAMRNWLHALMQGGALGIYGDYLFQETSPWSGNTIAETMVGPNVGTIAQIDALTRGNLIQAGLGEETDVGAEAVRLGRSHTPFMNLWYTRWLTDRGIWNRLSELADPGYLDKLEQRQERNAGTTYFYPMSANPWEGEFFERAPGAEE